MGKLMRRAAIAILCALPCMTAQADEMSGFEFELDFSRDRIPLSDKTHLDADGMGIRYRESTTLPLRLTLALGREVVSHDDDPLSLGFQPDGYYAGITIGQASSPWHALQIGADLSYSYHSATQQFNAQQLEIDWHRAEARGWLALRLNNVTKLYGCAIAANIDGTQTINGSTPSRIDFNNEQHTGYCGGIELEAGNSGYIGIEVESRYQRGGRLYFGKRYGF